MTRKYLYELTRKKDGRRETITTWSPCKGWKTVRKMPIKNTPDGRII